MYKQIHQTDQMLIPISNVAELTGINPITLRAWERRYGLPQPIRSETGRRLYSVIDVEKIRAIKQMLDEGKTISRAIAAVNQAQNIGKDKTEPVDVWQHYFARIKHAITDFDEHTLDDTYHEIIGLYPIDLVTQNLIVPLLDNLGGDWQTREGSVAEEHFFSTYLRNKLGARFHHQNRLNQGNPVLIAGLPGDQHELGLLLFALGLMSRGLRTLVLGPNLPIAELQHTLKKTNVLAIVLAGSHQMDIDRLIAKIKTLQQHSIPIFIGGNVVANKADLFSSHGIKPLSNDIPSAIETIMQFISDNQTRGSRYESI